MPVCGGGSNDLPLLGWAKGGGGGRVLRLNVSVAVIYARIRYQVASLNRQWVVSDHTVTAGGPWGLGAAKGSRYKVRCLREVVPMTEKLDIYDVLGSLIPGVLLVCWIPVCFPSILGEFSPLGTSEAISVIAFLAAAIFAGQVVQAVGSIVERPLFWTWGGEPSARALQDGLGRRYLPQDAAIRIKAKLSAAVGSTATDRSLFLYAMQCTDSAGVGRAPRFNSLYAYHRALFVLVLMMAVMWLVSAKWGAVAEWPVLRVKIAGFGALGLMLLVWYRAKQRAFYYVREVMLTAEKVLDDRASARPSSK